MLKITFRWNESITNPTTVCEIETRETKLIFDGEYAEELEDIISNTIKSFLNTKDINAKLI